MAAVAQLTKRLVRRSHVSLASMPRALIILHVARPALYRYIASPNVHEVRAYNRLARFARGELLVLFQGDMCPPPSNGWLRDAATLFDTLGPRLAAVGGKLGTISPIFDHTPVSYTHLTLPTILLV